MNAGREAGTTTVAGASARGLRQPTQRLLVKWGRRSLISASEKWLKRFRWLTEVQYNCNRALRIEKKMVRYLFFWNEIDYIGDRGREQYWGSLWIVHIVAPHKVHQNETTDTFVHASLLCIFGRNTSWSKSSSPDPFPDPSVCHRCKCAMLFIYCPNK